MRRSGDHIRLTAQLIDTHNGAHRWSDTYDREVGDILNVQREIAASLVRALQLEVTAASHLHGQESLRSYESYDFYLRGLHAKDRFDQQGFEEALADQRHALQLDPSFAPAAEQLALNLTNLAAWGFVPRQTGFDQARAATEAALKLDPKSAVAHAMNCYIYASYDWDWAAAAREAKTAVALAPNHPKVLQFAGIERLAVGQWSEAVRFLNASSTLDPLDPAVNYFSSWAYLRLGRLAEAESAARKVLELSPTYAGAHQALAIVLLMEGESEAALAELQNETPVSQLGLAVVYQALHRAKDADAALARLEAEHSRDRAMSIAEVYAFRGQKDKVVHPSRRFGGPRTCDGSHSFSNLVISRRALIELHLRDLGPPQAPSCVWPI